MFKFIGILAVLVFAAMQFARPERVNRRINESQTIEAQTNMPPDIASILDRSCKDCHSEKTVWRWYSNVAPVSWLQMADVGMARDLMNFSRWSEFNREQQEDRLKDICKMVRSGDMPPWYYKPLHPGSWLSQGDVDRLCGWTQTELQRLSENPPPSSPTQR